MKQAIIYCILFCLSSTLGADYPLADPQPGHGRPGWWWITYYHDVFIVKGTIESHDVVDTNRSYISKREVWDSLYFVKERAVADHKPPGKYLTGRLKVTETLHISSGYTKKNSDAKSLSNGQNLTLDVFIQAYKVTTNYSPGGAVKKTPDQYLAKYSSKDKAAWYMITPEMLVGMPTYYISHKINDDDLSQIKAILQFRKGNGTF